MRIAVVGASGFLGSVVADVLRSAGNSVVAVRAPRVPASFTGWDTPGLMEFRDRLAGVDAVVNCSGNPDASESDVEVLVAANAVSPEFVARAAKLAGVGRLVHVSSAVVQGRKSQLDETESTEEFSSYAHSKAEGERRVRRQFAAAVIYRPPSVHARGRRVTAMTARVAGSPLASVASPGDQPSPQALIQNVASAIAFLATTDREPPPIVIHPWEGLTSRDVMELLGGKPPLVLPRWLARAACRGLELGGTRVPVIAANARRIEMLWFGQRQGESWLTKVGWLPPHGRQSWRELGEEIRSR